MGEKIFDKAGITLDVDTYKPSGKHYDHREIENFDPRKQFDKEYLFDRIKESYVAVPTDGYFIVRWNMGDRGHEAQMVAKNLDGSCFINRLYKEEELS